VTPIIISSRRILVLLLRADLSAVRLCVRSARSTPARRTAIILSWMGNGLVYPMLIALLILIGGDRSQDLIAGGVVNIGLLHCLYPAIKRRTARPRPYHLHSDLAPLLKVLDEHSFPSGHAMTLTAALIPIVEAAPRALPASFALWIAMSWARLACAHHYPSDVLGGSVIALLVSYPISHFYFGII
jgi:undecaprenyl-diphosphatase